MSDTQQETDKDEEIALASGSGKLRLIFTLAGALLLASAAAAFANDQKPQSSFSTQQPAFKK